MSSVCKSTTAEFTANVLGRVFHVQIHDEELLKTGEVVGSMSIPRWRNSCKNVLRRGFCVRIHDGGVNGKGVKSWVPCANPCSRKSWKTYEILVPCANPRWLNSLKTNWQRTDDYETADVAKTTFKHISKVSKPMEFKHTE